MDYGAIELFDFRAMELWGYDIRLCNHGAGIRNYSGILVCKMLIFIPGQTKTHKILTEMKIFFPTR